MIYEAVSVSGEVIRGEELKEGLTGVWLTHRETYGYRSTKVLPDSIVVIEEAEE